MLTNNSNLMQKKRQVARHVKVVVLLCMIIARTIVAVKLRVRKVYIPDDGFAAEWSRSIVSGLIMHKTSAEMYTVCDTNGWGLINGNILRIATVNSPTSVVVEYIPFEQIETQKADNSSCLYGIITDLGGSNQQWRVEVYESLATLQSALGQQDDIEHLFRPVAVLGKELNSEL